MILKSEVYKLIDIKYIDKLCLVKTATAKLVGNYTVFIIAFAIIYTSIIYLSYIIFFHPSFIVLTKFNFKSLQRSYIKHSPTPT